MQKKIIILNLCAIISFICSAQSYVQRVNVNGKWGYGYPSLTHKDNNGYGIVDNLTIPAIYEETTNETINPAKGEVGGVKLNGKWGFIDASGATKIPFKYDDASFFQEGLAPVAINGKYGYIDKTGAVVIPLKYEKTDHFQDNGLAYVELGGKGGFINKAGAVVIPIKFDKWSYLYPRKCQDCGGGDMRSFNSNGKAAMVLNGKCGFIDMKGNFTECHTEPLDSTVFTGVTNGKKDKYGTPLGILAKCDCGIKNFKYIMLNDNEITGGVNEKNNTIFVNIANSYPIPGQKVTIRIYYKKEGGCAYKLYGDDQGIDMGASQGKMTEKVVAKTEGLDSTIFSGRITKDYASGFFDSQSGGYDDIKKIYLNGSDITRQCGSGARRVINFGVLKMKKGQTVTLKIVHKKGIIIKQLDPAVIE
jgi:hypothetical protein